MFCIAIDGGAATSCNEVSRVVSSPDNPLSETVAAVAAMLSQETGPLSQKPAVTGARLARVVGHSPPTRRAF